MKGAGTGRTWKNKAKPEYAGKKIHWDVQKKDALMYLALGYTQKDASAMAGISFQQLSKLRNYPEFEAELNHTIETVGVANRQQVLKNTNKVIQSIIDEIEDRVENPITKVSSTTGNILVMRSTLKNMEYNDLLKHLKAFMQFGTDFKAGGKTINVIGNLNFSVDHREIVDLKGTISRMDDKEKERAHKALVGVAENIVDDYQEAVLAALEDKKERELERGGPEDE